MYVIYEVTYVTNFYIRMVLLRIWGSWPLANTSLFTLTLKFCPNSLRMNIESQIP